MPAAKTRTRLRPIIRVFVSSTFSDLKLERDALQQRVFPKLEWLCQNDGFQFQAIDLRWGVPTEAGLHHRTMRVCFEELRRSQEVSPEPNFLILLGNRYGWRPLPEEISAEEFQRLEDAARQIDVGGQQQLIDVLRQWYLLDENSLTPVYILQPRRKTRANDPDSMDYTTLEAWHPVEQALWKVVNRAFPAEGLRDRFQTQMSSTDSPPSIVRFQASATEQEIWAGVLSVPNAEQHVRAFFRDISNRNDFSPFEVKDFFDLTEARGFDDASRTAQAELKEAIRSRLGETAVLPIPFSRLNRDEGEVAVDASQDDIQQFCDDVERALEEVIERQIREYWEPEDSDATNIESLGDRRMTRELEIERDEHSRFGKVRGSSDFFVGRDEKDGPLDRIRDYLAGDSRYPLVIHGDSGCGKTALLARAFEEIPEERQPMIRFIGATPRSSEVRSLLSSLCQELRLYNPIQSEFVTEYSALRQELQDQFRAATSDKPVILFLDSLDQLSDADSGRLLHWIQFRSFPPARQGCRFLSLRI
ncbi:DUF4062 domain-containing protein [Pirellulales bacterium]|nr:DUF4062 domain-containing protein [Pirellulales bacterium]